SAEARQGNASDLHGGSLKTQAALPLSCRAINVHDEPLTSGRSSTVRLFRIELGKTSLSTYTGQSLGGICSDIRAGSELPAEPVSLLCGLPADAHIWCAERAVCPQMPARMAGVTY